MEIGSQEIDGNLSIYWDTRLNRKNTVDAHIHLNNKLEVHILT